MRRFFVDSSVLFAAAYSPAGHARDLLNMAIRREVTLVISQLVLTETRRNLTESASGHTLILDYLLDNIPFETVRPTKRQVLSAAVHAPLKDAPILAAARRARVDGLVTFDRKHLLGKPALSAFVKAPIMTPKEALATLTTGR